MSDDLDFGSGKVLPPVRPVGWMGERARSFLFWGGLLLAIVGVAILAWPVSFWALGKRANAIVIKKERLILETAADPRLSVRRPQTFGETTITYVFAEDDERVIEGHYSLPVLTDQWSEGDRLEVLYWPSDPTNGVPLSTVFSLSDQPTNALALFMIAFGSLSAAVARLHRTGPAGSVKVQTSAPPVDEAEKLFPSLAAGAKSVLNVRFEPAACPACRSPFEVRYSRYQRARPHPLYGLVLILGIVLTLGLAGGAVWLGASLTLLVADRGFDGLRKPGTRTLGLLAFMFSALALVPVWFFTRWWWGRLYRLPRSFQIQCEACNWVGPCRVAGGLE